MYRLIARVLVCCSVMYGTSRAAAKSGYLGAAENLHVYVLMGDSNLISSKSISAESSNRLDRCFVMNEHEEWASAYIANQTEAGRAIVPEFVETMLEQNDTVSIGIIDATASGTTMGDWHRKSSFYRNARGPAKAAMNRGTLKGVLYRHAKNTRLSALDRMKDLLAYYRADLSLLNLPFVMIEVSDAAIDRQYAVLAHDVHAVAVASLSDDGSAMGLGRRSAEEMLKLHAAEEKKESIYVDIPFIDAHIHASSNKENGLDVLVKWMEKNNVSHCVTHALGPTRAEGEAQRKVMLANFAKYKGRIARYTYINPEEVSSVAEAVEILQREKADGAVGFGEHYGRNRMFDDPENLRLFKACEQVGFPVMFHIDSNKNMVEKGMRRVERVLQMFPTVKFIAHAHWWLYFPDGTCDRMLQEHPNLYADVSGVGMTAMLNRDRGYTEAFLERHADRILFGTDEGWWSLADKVSEHATFELFRELNLPEDVRYKIHRGNAEKLFGFTKQ